MSEYTMMIPSLKFCAQISCVNVLLELTDNGGPQRSQNMLRYLATGCFTAVSGEILQRIIEYFPDRLTSEILACLVPEHSKELCLSKCMKISPLKTAEILRRCPHLQKLDLSHCGIVVLPEMFQLLGLSQVLITHLSLEKCDMVNDEVVKSILRNMRSIQHLNISECRDITEKVFDLSQQLQGRKDSSEKVSDQQSNIECTLVSIDVSYCHGITDLSIQDLVRLTGKSLRHVNIACPRVTCLSLLCLSGYQLPKSLILNEDMEKVCLLLNDSIEEEFSRTTVSQQYSGFGSSDKNKKTEIGIQVIAPCQHMTVRDLELEWSQNFDSDNEDSDDNRIEDEENDEKRIDGDTICKEDAVAGVERGHNVDHSGSDEEAVAGVEAGPNVDNSRSDEDAVAGVEAGPNVDHSGSDEEAVAGVEAGPNVDHSGSDEDTVAGIGAGLNVDHKGSDAMVDFDEVVCGLSNEMKDGESSNIQSTVLSCDEQIHNLLYESHIGAGIGQVKEDSGNRKKEDKIQTEDDRRTSIKDKGIEDRDVVDAGTTDTGSSHSFSHLEVSSKYEKEKNGRTLGQIEDVPILTSQGRERVMKKTNLNREEIKLVKELHVEEEKSHCKITDCTEVLRVNMEVGTEISRRNSEDCAEKSCGNIENGTEKIHENFKDGTEKSHENFKDGTEKIHENFKDGTEKTHENFEDGTEKTHENFDDGTEKTHENFDDGTEKTHENFDDGTEKSNSVNLVHGCQHYIENENSYGAHRQTQSKLHGTNTEGIEDCSVEDISIAVCDTQRTVSSCPVNLKGQVENQINSEESKTDDSDHLLCVKNEQTGTLSTGPGEKEENVFSKYVDNLAENSEDEVIHSDDRDNENDGNTHQEDQRCESHHILQIYEPNLISVEVGELRSRNLEFCKILFWFFVLKNRNIQKFRISWSQFDDSCLDAISNCWRDLREISLIECQKLTTKSVMKLGTDCTQLRKVNLQGVIFIHDVAVVPFMKTGNLVKLNLAECNITDVVLIRLAAKSTATLESLDLSWCEELTQRGLNALCSKESPLKFLSLRQLPATNLTLALIAKNLRNLRNLNLSTIRSINNESIISLVKSLQLLESIDLSWNVGIGDEGIEAVLIYCTKLKTLVLSGLKLLTSAPFSRIISDIKQWKRCKSLLQYKHEERAVLREMEEDHLSSDEEYEELYVPFRSTTYAANLKSLSLEYCDSIDDQQMQEIVAICRGSLKVIDYYSEDVKPVMLRPKKGKMNIAVENVL